jgi:putative transposase
MGVAGNGRGPWLQAPVRAQPQCLAEPGLGRNPTNRGRSGGKLHRHLDRQRIPLAVTFVGAKVHDSRLVSQTLALDRVPRPVPTGEHPQHLCLDSGYDYTCVDAEVAGQAYLAHIRRMGEDKATADAITEPARRWVVERTIAWLKGFRAIRTRYTCLGANYLALVDFACALILSSILEGA